MARASRTHWIPLLQCAKSSRAAPVLSGSFPVPQSTLPIQLISSLLLEPAKHKLSCVPSNSVGATLNKNNNYAGSYLLYPFPECVLSRAQRSGERSSEAIVLFQFGMLLHSSDLAENRIRSFSVIDQHRRLVIEPLLQRRY